MLSRPSETSLSCDFFEPPRAASVRIEELTKYAHRGKSLRIKRMIGEQSETSGFQIMGSVTMAPDVKISKVVSEKDDDLMPRKSSHELLVAINFQPTLALQNELADAFIPCTPIKELCEDSSCDKFSLVGFFVNSVFKPIALMVKSYALEDPDDLAELGSFLFLHGISGLEDIAGDIF
ncbi:hypothetical protein HK096_000036 [Nowakowskiella sp. JEL0078]|nr:hypothetical protein HK096_000036 [Nowakowskiella sp. JEL0078]